MVPPPSMVVFKRVTVGNQREVSPRSRESGGKVGQMGGAGGLGQMHRLGHCAGAVDGAGESGGKVGQMGGAGGLGQLHRLGHCAGAVDGAGTQEDRV